MTEKNNIMQNSKKYSNSHSFMHFINESEDWMSKDVKTYYITLLPGYHHSNTVPYQPE